MADKICFGEYELDRDAGELRKHGVLIRLQDQTFRILAILTERHGQIVTREELRKQIWGEDTFVDFDQSLNKAVNRIRDALNDDAGTPRYVETVPRRGYRFIAPVEGHGKEDAPTQPISAQSSGTVQATSAPEFLPLQSLTTGARNVANSSRRRWRIAVFTFGLIVVTLLALAIWMILPLPQPRILKSTQLTNDGMGKMCCLVTDGSRIYFTENDPDTGYSFIKYVPVTGGQSTAIPVPTLKGSVGINDISPEHDSLLVCSCISPTEVSLWSVSLAASSPRPLADVHVGVGFNGIRWSPDGQKLVYADGSNLFLAQGDWSKPRKLLTTQGNVSNPVWSPDGKVVRFLATKSAASDVSTLLEISAGGGEPREVTPGWQPESSVCFGNWTPDGKYFVFLTDCKGKTNIWSIREGHTFLSLRNANPFC